jgi:hypothetical protein
MKLTVRRMIAPFLVLSMPTIAHADSDVQGWLVVAADAKVTDKTAVTADLILRSRSNSVDVTQAIGRVGVRQTLAEGWSAQLTYGLVDSFVEGGSDRLEHRIGQNLAFPVAQLGDWRIDGRAGFEQRLQSDGGEWGWRTRVRLRASQPLSDKANLQLSEELIGAFNDTAWGQRAGLTASRTSAAVRFKVSDSVGIAPSYNWQHIFVPGARLTDSHIATLTIDAHF